MSTIPISIRRGRGVSRISPGGATTRPASRHDFSTTNEPYHRAARRRAPACCRCRRPPRLTSLARASRTRVFLATTQFIVSSSFLIGNSDGPSQILLNSVAALFVLDADKLLAECFSTPWKQRTAEAKGERQEMSAFLEGHAQSISARCIGERWASTLSFVNFIYLITVAAALLWQVRPIVSTDLQAWLADTRLIPRLMPRHMPRFMPRG